MNRRTRSITAVAIAVAGTGCNVGPDYRRPAVTVPDHFGELPTTRPTTRAAADRAHSWEAPNGPELTRFLDRVAADRSDVS